MREFDYRSLLPTISFPRVETIIDDELIMEFIRRDNFISAPDIVFSHVIDVLKFRNLSYDCAFYYGFLITFHVIFDVLSFSMAHYIVDAINTKLAKTPYCLLFSNILPYNEDKVTFIISISKKL